MTLTNPPTLFAMQDPYQHSTYVAADGRLGEAAFCYRVKHHQPQTITQLQRYSSKRYSTYVESWHLDNLFAQSSPAVLSSAACNISKDNVISDNLI